MTRKYSLSIVLTNRLNLSSKLVKISFHSVTILLDYDAESSTCMMDSKGNISKDDNFLYMNTIPGGMILGCKDADDGIGVVVLCDADRKNMTTLCKLNEFEFLYLTPDLKYVALRDNVLGKCGLYSVETGEPVIKPKYDELIFEDEECIFFKSLL